MLFTTVSCIMGTSIDGYKPFWLPACFVRINSLSETQTFICVESCYFVVSWHLICVMLGAGRSASHLHFAGQSS